MIKSKDEDCVLSLTSFEGETGLNEALKECIIYACQQGANTLYFCDADFSSWPLNRMEVITALTEWARSTSNQRRLTILAGSYRVFERDFGLWLRWRDTWGHRVQCLEFDDDYDIELPCVFWSDCVMVQVRNFDNSEGNVSQSKHDLLPMLARLEGMKNNASPSFPSTTLGL